MPRRVKRKFLASATLGGRQEALCGTAEAVPFQSKSGQVAEVSAFWETRAGAGLSPGFREKHAEPKARDVIVSSLQDSVVAYLYPALTRPGLKYSAPAELKCGKWAIARKLESDGPRERGARSGE